VGRKGSVGKNSKIEWTHHTFNPWWGCVKLSPACKNCYAETWARRVGAPVWGARAPRRFFTDNHWCAPLKWNREAEQDGVRRRVFCASMADVFEDRRDLDEWRNRLWRLIEATPQLDWLLLTKRPERVAALANWRDGLWPGHVWLGTTVETQIWAGKRLPALAAVPAAVRFVSCEPLLGPLNLTPWLGTDVQWVIAGGESGPHSRPSNPAWFRSLRDQCLDAQTAFHFKQWGNWSPAEAAASASRTLSGQAMVRLDKRTAGRVLDGQTWDQLPA